MSTSVNSLFHYGSYVLIPILQTLRSIVNPIEVTAVTAAWAQALATAHGVGVPDHPAGHRVVSQWWRRVPGPAFPSEALIRHPRGHAGTAAAGGDEHAAPAGLGYVPVRRASLGGPGLAWNHSDHHTSVVRGLSSARSLPPHTGTMWLGIVRW